MNEGLEIKWHNLRRSFWQERFPFNVVRLRVASNYLTSFTSKTQAKLKFCHFLSIPLAFHLAKVFLTVNIVKIFIEF